MRYRLVPPAADIDRLEAIRAAVPADPEAVDDCCARLCEQAGVPDRATAREWLVFLRALGLVEQKEGYARTHVPVERRRLASAFEQNVYGVPELLTGDESIAQLTEQLRIDEEYATRVYGWADEFGLVE